MTLYVPLEEPGRSDCGVAVQDDFYSVVIDIREHHIVEMVQDTSFLVQCSATESAELRDSLKAEMRLEILKDDRSVRETVVGELYTIELDLPNNYFYQVTSCIAFSGTDIIRFLPLMDSTGCPIEDMITPFFPVFGTGKVRAELTMFRFNDTNEFHVQCTVSSCEERCIQPSCRKEKDANIVGPRILSQNSEEAFAAFRVSVLDQSQVSKYITLKATLYKMTSDFVAVVEQVGCNYRTEPGLVGLTVLLIVLIFLTFVLCALGFYNRPFKCQMHERDSVSINEELIQIVEEPQDIWSVLSRLKFRFPLPLPSTQQLVITTLPSTHAASSHQDSDCSPSQQNQTKPIIQLEESTVAGSTLRSRKNPGSGILSRKTSKTSVSTCKSVQSRSIRSEITTLDRAVPVLEKPPAPTPPPRVDSIPKKTETQNPTTPSPPLPPAPHLLLLEKISNASSEGNTSGSFPPPPCLTSVPTVTYMDKIKIMSRGSKPINENDSPTYAVPQKTKGKEQTDLSESTEYYAVPSVHHSTSEETENIHSLISSFTNRLVTKDRKIFFSEKRSQNQDDAWPYS